MGRDPFLKGFSLAGVWASERFQNICFKSVLDCYSSKYASESKAFHPLTQNHAFWGHNQCIHLETFRYDSANCPYVYRNKKVSCKLSECVLHVVG